MRELELRRERNHGSFNMPRQHFHDYYEIYYLLSGERGYFIENDSYSLQEGELVFIKRNQLHRSVCVSDREYERILVIVPEWVVADEASPALLLQPFQHGYPKLTLHKDERSTVEQLLFTMLREQENQTLGWKMYNKALLVQLLLICGRLLEQSSDQRSMEHPQPMRQKMKDITAFINHNFQQDLTVTSVAERFYLSPGHFSRSFKEATGFTFVEYVNSVRIRESQRLLRETDDKVTLIAERAGYDSLAHFGRVFKHYTRRSPLEYRKWVRSRL